MTASTGTPTKWRYLIPLLVALCSALLTASITLAGFSSQPNVQTFERSNVQTQPAGPQGGCIAWRVVPSPYNGTSFDHLYATDVLHEADAWAVGETNFNTLIMRWDGSVWTAVDTSTAGSLRGVSALADNDVWAVGYSGSGASAQTLLMHWDGATWTTVPGPNPGTGGNYLYSVAAIAPDDVWAVGYFVGNTSQQTLIVHYDGTKWSLVNSPNITGSDENRLYGVAAYSATDIWAVGYYLEDGANRTLTAHWNGTLWSLVDSPSIGTESNVLRGVAAVSETEAWAVGSYVSEGNPKTLALRWNGTEWEVVYTPNASTSNELYSVTVASPTELWAVGDNWSATTKRTLSLRWNGTQWGRISSPNVGSRSNSLYGVAAFGPADVQAVGHFDNGSAYQSLVARYSAGPCNTPTATRTGTPPTATPTSTPVCGLSWRSISSANPGTADNRLHGVAVAAQFDVWSVGTSAGRNLAMRWNGLSWAVISSPNVGSFSNVLRGVAVAGPDDVWAVGAYSNGSADRTLVLHWDGEDWLVVSSPNVGSGSNTLYGLAVVAPDDIWAVGSHNNGQGTLVLHWDGVEWAVVTSPSPGTGENTLRAVWAASATDIWAVGISDNGGVDQTMVLHSNGNTWDVVSSPNPGTGDNRLYGITGTAADNVWAAGSVEGRPLTMRWDGTAWTDVPAPNLPNSPLYGVAAVSASDIWAVGTQDNLYTVVLHWDGGSWTRVPSPNPSTGNNNVLNAIAPYSATDVWAVGTQGTLGQTLVERYTDLCVEATPPPGTPTNTATATRTPQNTPVSRCPGNRFTDVCPEDYFFVPVMYLSDHNVISGYADGSFRPTNNTTRGALAKIIVLAQEWPIDTEGGPHFTDVPTDNTFYPYIETAYNREIISGYADGTFRWNSNVTRAQLSKIVVTAKGWDLVTPPNATFIDVATDNPFFLHVETAYEKGIISGYGDGTFRPGNNATRGQICKIVYLAVTQP